MEGRRIHIVNSVRLCCTSIRNAAIIGLTGAECRVVRKRWLLLIVWLGCGCLSSCTILCQPGCPPSIEILRRTHVNSLTERHLAPMLDITQVNKKTFHLRSCCWIHSFDVDCKICDKMSTGALYTAVATQV